MSIQTSIRSSAFTLLSCVLACSAACAAWNPDGNRVSFHVGDVYEYTAIPFGDGGALMVWSSFDPADYIGSGEIYAQALDSDGNVMPGWPPNGLPITAAEGTQRYATMAPDGVGGAFVVWLDFATGGGKLRIQHLTEMGAVALGWPATGRVAGDDVVGATSPMAPDGAGGVYVVWTAPDTAPGSASLRLVRIGSDGEVSPGWPVDGLTMGAPGDPWAVGLAPDGEGGVFLGRTEFGTGLGTALLLIQRFAGDGTLHPAWPSGGIAVGEVDNAYGFDQLNLVPDGRGGLYAAWWRSQFCWLLCLGCCPPPDQIASHLDSNGALVAGWPAKGLSFGNAGRVAADARGGLLVATTSTTVSGGQYFRTRGLVTRVRPDGTPAPGWAFEGNPMCSEPRHQTNPAIVPDGFGGAYVSWIDARTFEAVLYVSRLTPSGWIADGWPATGSIGSESAVSPDPPLLVSGNPGQAIVVWVDRRNGSPQLYAEQARPGPPGPPAPRAGLGFAVADVRPNPARGAFWATVSLPEPGEATLELFDVAGRVLESRRISGARVGVVRMNPSGRLAAGVYWLRLRQESASPAMGARSSTAKVILVP